MIIACPKCGNRGVIDRPASDLACNDNEDIVKLPMPEGFRKVQQGWASDQVHVFCVTCCVPAEIIELKDSN